MGDDDPLAVWVRSGRRSISILLQDDWSGAIEFVARGNWVYPANTTAGGRVRLTLLRGPFLSATFVPQDIRSLSARTEPPGLGCKGPPRASRNDRLTGSVKYVGRCEPSP
jgi:hypothetical protein